METSGCGAGQPEACGVFRPLFKVYRPSISPRQLLDVEPACLARLSRISWRRMFRRESDSQRKEGKEDRGVSRMRLNGGKWPAAEEGHPGGPHLRADRPPDSLSPQIEVGAAAEVCGLISTRLHPPALPSTGTPCLYRLSIVGTNLIYKQKATYNTFYSFWTIERALGQVLHLKTDIHVVIQQYCHEFIKHSLENKAEHIFSFVETRCNSHNNLFRRLLLLSWGPMVRTRGAGSVPRVLLARASCPTPSSFTSSPPAQGLWGCWFPACHGDLPAWGRCVGQATFLPSPSSELWPCPWRRHPFIAHRAFALPEHSVYRRQCLVLVTPSPHS